MPRGPFRGPAHHDRQRQHLPGLPGGPTQLNELVEETRELGQSFRRGWPGRETVLVEGLVKGRRSLVGNRLRSCCRHACALFRLLESGERLQRREECCGALGGATWFRKNALLLSNKTTGRPLLSAVR